MMLHRVNKQISGGELKSSDVDESIQLLLLLEEDGLLEAYVLFALADEGISRDYEVYCVKNKEALTRFLDRYAIHDKQ